MQNLKPQFKIQNFIFLSIVFSLVSPTLISAAGLVPCGGTGEGPCTLCHLFQLFANIADFVFFRFVPPIAILMMVYGGVMFFLAAGDPGKLGQAKGILTSVVLGLIIIYTAWLLVNLFFTSINESVSFNLTVFDPSEWFEFQCP